MSQMAEIVEQSDEQLEAAAWDDGFAAGFREGGSATMNYIMAWGPYKGIHDEGAEIPSPPQAEDYIGDYIERWGRT